MIRIRMLSIAVLCFLVFAGSSDAVELKLGDVIAAECNKGTLYKIDPVTKERTLLASGLNNAQFIALKYASDGKVMDIFVSDTSGYRIVRLDPVTFAQTNVVTSGGLLGWPRDLVVDGDGDLLVADYERKQVVRVNPRTGEQSLVSSGDILRGPMGLAIERTGSLVVADNLSKTILRVDPCTGEQSKIYEYSVDEHVTHVVIDAQGDFIVGEYPAYYHGTISRINPTTGVRSVISKDGLMGFVWEIALDENGKILVADAAHQGIYRIDPIYGTQEILLRSANDGGAGGDWFDAVAVVAPVSNVPKTRSMCLVNSSPTADAGLDQTVKLGAGVVTLDGSGSPDPDSDSISYSWSFKSKPEGSAAQLVDPVSAVSTFVPDVLGTYEVQLVVTDEHGASSAPDVVVISTTNSAPKADAGADQAIIVIGGTVNLNGSGSYDDDGDAITYLWTFSAIPPGSQATLFGAKTVSPSFTADVHGDYVVQLVVSDPWSFGQDTVTMSFVNSQPVASAGSSQSVTLGQTVALDGGASSDANGDPLTCLWSIVSAPLGSSAALNGFTEREALLLPDLPGLYVVQLVVNDGFVDSVPGTVQIQVSSGINSLIQVLQELQHILALLDPSSFKNANMGNTMINTLNAVIGKVEGGNYKGAVQQLQNDLLGKIDGCARTGAPDKNDWLVTSASQGSVYPLTVEAIEILGDLL